MQRSLSILFPVRNVQATLTASVHEILDTVADAGGPFEVVIIDDGSADATGEVAHELTRHYPQVRVVSHTQPQGREAAIHTGLQRSQGEVVVVHEGRRGYRLVDRPGGSVGVPSRPARPNYLSRSKKFMPDE